MHKTDAVLSHLMYSKADLKSFLYLYTWVHLATAVLSAVVAVTHRPAWAQAPGHDHSHCRCFNSVTSMVVQHSCLTLFALSSIRWPCDLALKWQVLYSRKLRTKSGWAHLWGWRIMWSSDWIQPLLDQYVHTRPKDRPGNEATWLVTKIHTEGMTAPPWARKAECQLHQMEENPGNT